MIIPAFLQAQVSFRTIVPQNPVVEGEAFRIQYVIDETEKVTGFSPPVFKGFRLVNGPQVYEAQGGTVKKPRVMKNLIYTLQATRPGTYYLPGATATMNGLKVRSNDVLVEVIARKDAHAKAAPEEDETDEELATYLKPDEDPYEKIRNNLFIRVIVDKTICYPGEPVVATFKLYSRLVSRSDIIKNPGFYGFAVQDMVNIEDHIVNTETVDGRDFDVHTVRKVQLYPLQAGSFLIDAMQLKNSIEFSRSSVSRKSEQEISEGIFEEEEDEPLPGTETYETEISTRPVSITVRPLPVKNKPENFSEGTGKFRISSSLLKNELSRGEEGYLVVKVEGSGNFQQLAAPEINWPVNMEGFEPDVEDKLDKMSVPMSGSRSFIYSFVADVPGNFTLPAVEFSFFDPDSNKYRTIRSKPVSVSVTANARATDLSVPGKKSRGNISGKISWIAATIIVLLIVIVIGFWIFHGKKPVIKKEVLHVEVAKATADDLLRPLYLMIPAGDREFYSLLQKTIWNWLGSRFGLSGTAMNKQSLVQILALERVPAIQGEALVKILTLCEEGMYTNSFISANRENLLIELKEIMQSIGT
jgi:hypothetical protein